MPKAALRFTQGRPKEFTSSPGVARSFCDACGSPIYYRVEDRPNAIDLYACTLDDPSNLAPQYHVHAVEQLPQEHPEAEHASGKNCHYAGCPEEMQRAGEITQQEANRKQIKKYWQLTRHPILRDAELPGRRSNGNFADLSAAPQRKHRNQSLQLAINRNF